MENPNQNQPTPQPLTPPEVEGKKWYQHNGILIIIVLAVIAAGVSWYYIKSTSPTNYMGQQSGNVPTSPQCSDSAAKTASQQKNLKQPHDCQVSDISVDGSPAKLVIITYGPKVPFDLSWGYASYEGVVLNNKTSDVQGEPETYPVFTKTYGDWCNVQSRDLTGSAVTKYLTQVNGSYDWGYKFNNFNNEDRIKSLLTTSQILQSEGSPQYCVLNGTMVITSTSEGYAETIDFSKLSMQLQPLPGATAQSTQELLQSCNNETDPTQKSQCIENIAMGKRDPSICQGDGSCIRGVAVMANDPSICDNIPASNLEHDHCYQNVALVMKDASVCDKIVDSPSDKQGCIDQVSNAISYSQPQSAPIKYPANTWILYLSGNVDESKDYVSELITFAKANGFTPINDLYPNLKNQPGTTMPMSRWQLYTISSEYKGPPNGESQKLGNLPDGPDVNVMPVLLPQ